MRRLPLISALCLPIVILAVGCGPSPVPSQSSAPPAQHPDAASRTTTAFRPHHFSLRQVAVLPEGTDRLAVAAFGSGYYIFGGLTNSGSITTIDHLQGEKVAKAGRLPQPTHDLAAVALGRRILVLGGGSIGSYDSITAYSPVSRATQSLGTLPTPLSDLAAVRLGASVYTFGGNTGSVFSRAIYRIGPSGRAALAGTLPVGLRYTGAAASGGSVYLFGGLTPSGYTNAIWRFTPGKGVHRVGSLPAAVCGALVAAGPQGILIAGGELSPGEDTATLSWFTPRTGLTRLGYLPRPLAYGAAAASGRGFLLLGGEDGAARSSGIWLLTPRP